MEARLRVRGMASWEKVPQERVRTQSTLEQPLGLTNKFLSEASVELFQ